MKCKATGTSGPNGFGLDQVQKMLGDLFSKLMQQNQNGKQNAQPQGNPQSTDDTERCTTYYNVTTPTSDPCAIYVPPVSNLLNNATGSTANSLSNLLNQNINTNTNTATSTNTAATSSAQAQTQLRATVGEVVTSQVAPSTTRPVVPQVVGNLAPGVSGDIQVFQTGGTIIAGSRDAANNSVTAGFFGSNTFTGQPQGVVAKLCQSRPWASNFLSYVLPASFFDSLCALRGYQVGLPQQTPPPVVTVVRTKPAPVASPAATSTAPKVEPRVDIWAAPASVPLGSRTSVFWTSQGVKSCLVTSPDGSFSQNTLSGGASTVALTGATTFTISCLTDDNTPVTDFVTVTLSI